MNSVWQIDPGFMDTPLLNEQMRLVSGMLRGTTSANPVPENWLGHEDALVVRLNQLMAEMQLREIPTPEWQPVTEDAVIWPSRMQLSINEELDHLQRRSATHGVGRIQLPANDHALWACFKYSVMARNYESYRSFGQRVAVRSIAFDILLEELIHIARIPPSVGGLRNALQHMWGYVSSYSSINPNDASLQELLREVQRQSYRHRIQYLLNSTALSDLTCWLEGSAFSRGSLTAEALDR